MKKKYERWKDIFCRFGAKKILAYNRRENPNKPKESESRGIERNNMLF